MRKDFEFLSDKDIYLDNACQSQRPKPVIDALLSYYMEHNSCGERVKYQWGKITDQKVSETRELVLKFLKLSPKDYFVSFTLNTTYGINLILNQIKSEYLDKIMTSDIEHNSPFLSTITYAKKNNLPREVIIREADGSIDLSKYDFNKALVVLNCVSNIDGRKLDNLDELITKVHKSGGIIIIDAAQSMAHDSALLHKTKADAICFSAHKMYAPTLGGMVVRRDLIKKLETTFIGGGMVDDVTESEYKLSHSKKELVHTIFESGLQAFGEIIALGAAIKWLMNLPKENYQEFETNYNHLYDYLNSKSRIVVINTSPTPTLSFYIENIDSHLLGIALGDENIMTRTGYFCCHYYLDHRMHYPPLVRLSLGLHNTKEDIEKVIETIERILK